MKNFTRTFPKYNCLQPSNNRTLSFRPFLVADEKSLLIIKEEKDPCLIVKNILNILSACFDDLDMDNLTLQDMEYLFCMLRSKSVGEVVKTTFICPATNEKISTHLDLSTILTNNSQKEKELILDSSFKIILKEPSVHRIISLKGNFDTDHLIKSCIFKVFKEDSVFDAQDLSDEDLNELIKNLTTKEHVEMKKFIVNLPKCFANISYTTKDEVVRQMRLDGVLNFFTYA